MKASSIFCLHVAFFGTMVFLNKEQTIDTCLAKIVHVLTTKAQHTLASIILSNIYRAMILCKARAKFFEGYNILQQIWLIEHLSLPRVYESWTE